MQDWSSPDFDSSFNKIGRFHERWYFYKQNQWPIQSQWFSAKKYLFIPGCWAPLFQDAEHITSTISYSFQAREDTMNCPSWLKKPRLKEVKQHSQKPSGGNGRPSSIGPWMFFFKPNTPPKHWTWCDHGEHSCHTFVTSPCRLLLGLHHYLQKIAILIKTNLPRDNIRETTGSKEGLERMEC
jgi:hypothetical protein